MHEVEYISKDHSHGVKISPEVIDEFIFELKQRGRSVETCNIYRRKLTQCYEMLGENKSITRETLLELRDRLLAQGTNNGGANIFVSALNTFFDYCGRRDLQVTKLLEPENQIQPELTRSEYLRLLQAANTLNRPRPYLLVKVLANTGLNIRELPLVTCEAAKLGRISVPDRGVVHITQCLCDELLSFSRQTGVKSGPIFVTSKGCTMSRGAINTEIRRLAETARVAEEKCTPIALRRLYLATHENIMSSLALLVEQSFDRLVENEQIAFGWSETDLGVSV